MTMYIVYETIEGETMHHICKSDWELIEYFNMSDCYTDVELGSVYKLQDNKPPKKIYFVGWQPNCLIEFKDGRGQTVVYGFGEDH